MRNSPTYERYWAPGYRDKNTWAPFRKRKIVREDDDEEAKINPHTEGSSLNQKRRRILDSDDEQDMSRDLRKQGDSRTPPAMEQSTSASLASLPVEILQHILLELLLHCLHDYDTGEHNMRAAVLALSATSHKCRSNIATVIRMLRKEIAIGGTLVDHCARPWEMRVLVLSLDYNLSTGSTVKIKIERFRAIEADMRGGKRLKLMIDGARSMLEEEDEDQS